MKRIFTCLTIITIAANLSAQEEENTKKEHDTTRLNFGKIEVLIVDSGFDKTSLDTIKIDPISKRKSVAHWAGIDFGFNVLLNDNRQTNFSNDNFLRNDIAQSHVWNLNLFDHKFKLFKEYVGITTGIGFNFTQVAFENNSVLGKLNDSTFANIDTLVNYDKNKLKATYLMIPLLLEFNTHKNNYNGFYLAAGIVGGLRISSRYKRVEREDGNRQRTIQKGDFNLNPLKLDLLARFGYKKFGGFVSYSLTPLFEKGATQDEAFALTAGISLNF